jgi:acetyl-CoA carboxylase biotin carboxyl carrier protein
MDIKDLKVLIKLVTETDITEFEVENADEKVIIKRGKEQEVIHVAPPAAYAAPAPMPVAPPSAPEASTPSEAETRAAALSDKYETINSPIVGTFYHAASPDSDPYVEVGSVVKKGQILCIVEAMKLMNEIEAEFPCKVIEMLKENAQPVEFGDPLFLVERL